MADEQEPSANPGHVPLPTDGALASPPPITSGALAVDPPRGSLVWTAANVELSDGAKAGLERRGQAQKARASHAKVRSMYEVAPNHKRKARDVLVQHEQGKVRRAVGYLDNKRRRYPDKYHATVDEDNKLKRLVNRFPHVSAATMRLEVTKIRVEIQHGADEEKTLKTQLKTARKHLKTAKSQRKELKSLQLEKDHVEAQLAELHKQVRALTEATEANEQEMQRVNEECTKLKTRHASTAKHQLAIEEKLKQTQADLDKATRDGTSVAELMREKNELKTQLWALNETQKRDAESEREQTRLLAQSLRQQKKLSVKLQTTEAQLQVTKEERKNVVNQLLAEISAKDELLRAQAAEKAAKEEEMRRLNYIKDAGPRIEKKMIALVNELRVKIVAAIQKSVSGDATQARSFRTKLENWLEMRNKVAHELKAAENYVKEGYDAIHDAVEDVSQHLDRYYGFLRGSDDRHLFLSRVVEVMKNT